jgi:hypothetical protein
MKENIILHSIGDCFPQGRFTEIDSVFEKVVNFTWGNKVVSVCTPELYPGPYHIVVSGIRPEEIIKFEVRRKKEEGREVNDPPPPLPKGGYYSITLFTESVNIQISPRFSREGSGVKTNCIESKLCHPFLRAREGLGVSYEDSKNGVLLHIDPGFIYHSSLDIKTINLNILVENIDYLRKFLHDYSNDGSLAFLLDEQTKVEDLHPEVCATLQKGTGNREQGTVQSRKKIIPEESVADLHPEVCATGGDTLQKGKGNREQGTVHKMGSTFDKAYRIKFQELFKQLKENKTPESLFAFHGYGYGLTPSGDDFIIGYMIGLRILLTLGKNELSKQLDSIYSGILRNSSNRLVNTFVQMAYEGNFTEPWKLFVTTLLNSRLEHAKASLEAILHIGATSGTDTLVGLITTLDGLSNSDSTDRTKSNKV